MLAFALTSLPALAVAQPVEPPRGENPAKDADPPLLPEPQVPPLSTSGSDVAPAGRAPSQTVVVGGAGQGDEARDRHIEQLQERLERSERRIRRLEERSRILRHLTLSAYVQPQFLITSFNTAASPNLRNGALPPGIEANDVVANPDGSTTNGTFFRLRRTRFRTLYETDVMRLWMQIDVLPAGGLGPGIGTIIRNAEATGKIKWSPKVRTEVTAGMFFTPARAELQEWSNNRPFIERTWFVQNVFPIERDIGAHVKTLAFDDRLIVDLGIVNGQRLGERFFVQTPDLNKSKDFVGFVTYRLGPLTAGVNGYVGRGQVVDGEQLRFKQFTRWMVNPQATLKWKLLRRVGESRLLSELTFGENMDAGVIYPFAVPVIPLDIHADVESLRQRTFYVRAEQDLSRWFMLGYRYDMYTPNVSIKNNARDTHSFLAVVNFSQNLRWMNELGWAIDNVHPFGTPAPSRHIVTFSSVLQAGFY